MIVPGLFGGFAPSPNIRVEVRAPNPERSFEMLEAGEMICASLGSPSRCLRCVRCSFFQDRIVCIADAVIPQSVGR